MIPVRVADSVVLFSNSSIAQGFDYVHSLLANPATRVHVITLSMGGMASQAWADAVNALYEAGVFIVTAAGNNHANLPTRNIVYPARFRRVVAACGVMADGRPYADLPNFVMAGNYGPASKMDTAIAAFTPNTAWAKIGCPHIVNHNGAGTSSTTPQVAAAAALYFQRHRADLDDPAKYPEPWMRVEAVRAALFGAARKTDVNHFGQGTLRAQEALAIAPAASATLTQQPPDAASFELLRIITGFGLSGSPVTNRMIELEALQLSQSSAIEALLPDPERLPADGTQRAALVTAVAEAMVSDPKASQSLRAALGPLVAGRIHAVPAVPAVPAVVGSSKMDDLHLRNAITPHITRPDRRKLRVYAYDPSLEVQLETYAINQALVDVRWEKGLQPGPVGEYVEVVDVDPSSRCCYAPVDLDDPYLLRRTA